MKYFFYGLLLVLLFSTILYNDKKIRKDEYCKESLLKQFLFDKCTLRDKLKIDKNKENV